MEVGWPLAAIVIVLSIVALCAMFIRFREAFSGVSLGWKDNVILKIPEPSSSLPKPTSSSTPEPEKADTAGKPEDATSPIDAMFAAIKARDRQGIDKAIDDLALVWPAERVKAFKLSRQLEAGFTDALATLKELETGQSTPYASFYLVRYYLMLKSDSEAEVHLKSAEKRSVTEEQKVEIFKLRAQILANKDKTAAAAYLGDKARKISDRSERSGLWDVAGDYYRDAGRRAEAAICYQAAILSKPEDAEVRFKLALLFQSFDAAGLLSLHHYQIILNQHPDYLGVRNNIGILYGDLALSSEKIHNWAFGAAKDDAHSVSNLINAYVEGGFLDDARNLIQTHSQLSDSDRMISARKNVSDAERQADETLERLKERSARMASDAAEFAFAEQTSADHIVGEWKSLNDSDTLTITRSSNYLKFVLKRQHLKPQFSYVSGIDLITPINFTLADSEPKNVLLGATTDADSRGLLLVGSANLRLLQTYENIYRGAFDFVR